MRKPSKKEFLRLNNMAPAASAMPRPSRKRPPRKTKMYAEALSMKENMKGTAILVNGRRIKAVDGVWQLVRLMRASSPLPYVLKLAMILSVSTSLI